MDEDGDCGPVELAQVWARVIGQRRGMLRGRRLRRQSTAGNAVLSDGLQDRIVVGGLVLFGLSQELGLEGILAHGRQAPDEKGVDTEADLDRSGISPHSECLKGVIERGFRDRGGKGTKRKQDRFQRKNDLPSEAEAFFLARDLPIFPSNLEDDSGFFSERCKKKDL
ncbi:hypothetical protein PG994_009746 [Apiospora phragmitis]|uniref:Uncharacterized protein n=1 Tax=Apiospora phragmitis TaxID=2905665 RepID=A0ABR1U9R7_9PEZI